MSHIWSIAAKELRGYFHSAVALIFLATFLAVVLFTFFWVEKFFARNLADVRPLFEWLPLLLILLVAALTMRLWSEEQKTGTLEILLTLSVPVHRLVLGKFLAGFILVAIALGLTLGLPLTVNHIGELDWGPVVGGYLAALLLAGTYLAIGLCVSSGTDNQIVALIVTIAVCGVLYLVGVDQLTDEFPVWFGEVLRGIGTGSRFDSVARGVLDLRDLVYYGSLIAVFLSLNVLLLQAKRWSHGARTRAARRNAVTAVALIALNAVALNIWLAPVVAMRVDLTRGGQYSLSDTTEELLASLDEPLVIRGYFSEDTHPLLKPLVPQIRDLLTEYQIAGGSRVRMAFLDPSHDEALATELSEQYNVQPQSLPFEDHYKQGRVDVFFHILVEFGDQHEVLDMWDLINVGRSGDKPDVRVGNLEYEITRAIHKAVLGFQSIDALFAALADKVTLEAHITPATLPEELKPVHERLETVAKELAKESGGKFEYTESVPDTEDKQIELFEKYRIRPLPASFFLQKVVYFHLLLSGVGDRPVLIRITQDLSEVQLRELLVKQIESAAPGFIKVVGLVTPPQGPPQQVHPQAPPQPTPPAQQFNVLRQTLGDNHEVRLVDLEDGTIPDEIDVLILAGPDNLGAEAVKAVDQFVMRGGALIVLAGKYRLKPLRGPGPPDLSVEQVTTGLEDMLARWGITLGNEMVADSNNEQFVFFEPLRRGPPKYGPYPFFVRVPRSGLHSGGIVTSGLTAAIMHWAVPVLYEMPAPPEGEKSQPDKNDEAGEDSDLRMQVLLASSDSSWLAPSTIQPNFSRRPEDWFEMPEDLGDKAGPHNLAVALTGTFRSAVAEDYAKKNESKGEAPKEGEAAADNTERLLARSTPDARVAVIGSSSFVADLVWQFSRELGAADIENNMLLIQNLIDWATEDTTLLSIRAGTSADTLEVPRDSYSKWEILNYLFALLGLALAVGVGRLTRKPAIDLAAVGRRTGDKSAAVARGTSADDADSDPAGASRKDPDDDRGKVPDDDGEDRA